MALSDIHRAIRRGDTDTVRSLIASGVRLDERSPQGRTPLHVATEEGDVETVRRLIDAGAPVDATTRDGLTALHLAAALGGDLDLADRDNDVQLEVEKRCASILRPSRDRTLSLGIFEAVARRDPRLADLEPDSDIRGDPERFGAVFETLGQLFETDEGRRELYDDLRAQGLDIDETDPTFARQLTGEPEPDEHFVAIAKALLSAGADVAAADERMDTPLHHAAQAGSDAMVRVLLESGADPNSGLETPYDAPPLGRAIEEEHRTVVETLLAFGADIESSGPSFSAVAWASTHGQTDLLELFLSLGGSAEKADEDGDTPLHFAASEGHLDTTRRLVEAGADVRRTNDEGDTPIRRAANFGSVELVRWLADRGGDVRATPTGGASALHKAVENGDVDMVQALIELGADVHAVTYDGLTPIQSIFEYEYAPDVHVPIVEVLLAHGADPTQRDADGKSLLDYAREYSMPELVAVLDRER